MRGKRPRHDISAVLKICCSYLTIAGEVARKTGCLVTNIQAVPNWRSCEEKGLVMTSQSYSRHVAVISLAKLRGKRRLVMISQRYSGILQLSHYAGKVAEKKQSLVTNIQAALVSERSNCICHLLCRTSASSFAKSGFT